MAELGVEDAGFAAALHSGECELGHDGVHGLAVGVAEQLAASARAGEVLVSQTVRDLVVGSTVEFEPRGVRNFDGVPDEWDVFAVVGNR